MQKPSLGWQSWSPPFPKWHGYPRWDYPPFKVRDITTSFRETPERPIAISYWCSWYAYGWNITDKKILETLKTITQHHLPFTHILIDDGWTIWGDWLTPSENRFPNIATTINNIHSANLKAGLWFAPFLASKKSQLFKTHADWFITYRGRYVQGLKTVPIWDSLLPQQYLLDLSNPEAKKYLTDFIDLAVKKWKIDLLKLDFLYAVYFDPNHKSDTVAHSQVVWIFNYIKTNYPHVQTIACGNPFSPTLGVADIVRISKDTALPPVVPKFINSLIYTARIKLLRTKMNFTHLMLGTGVDPDVRLFNLDNTTTSSIWDTIATNILGVGDNLTRLTNLQLKKVKIWLTNHNSQ